MPPAWRRDGVAGSAAGRGLRFLRFVCVGATATATQYAVLAALVETGATGPVAGSSLGFCLGAGLNYALNYRFTFRSDRPHREAVARFCIVAAGGAALNGAMMALAIRGLAWPYPPAQLMATGLVVAWSFAANDSWTFRRAERPAISHPAE